MLWASDTAVESMERPGGSAVSQGCSFAVSMGPV